MSTPKRIFITYGSGDLYRKSLRLISSEAQKLRLFDKIIVYRPQDMPDFIQSSPLSAYQRGNGYWVWKPWIIWSTLQKYPNAIVVYADGGCTLQPNYEEWNSWFDLMAQYDALAFQYRPDVVYPWMEGGICTTTRVEWTKRALLDFFADFQGGVPLYDTQIQSGVVVAKNANNKAIKMWLDLTLLHPELVIDCYGREAENQYSEFIEHRHDQSMWDACARYWAAKNVVKILPETGESRKDAAILCTRRRKEKLPPLKTRIIWRIKSFIGENMYEFLHGRRKQ